MPPGLEREKSQMVSTFGHPLLRRTEMAEVRAQREVRGRGRIVKMLNVRRK